MNVWRCIVLVLCLSAGTSYAQTSFNARTWLFTQNVTRAASEARFLQWFQAESLELNILAREETNVLHQLGPLDLSATNLLHVWECAAETNIHTVYFAVTGTVQDATNGHVRYRVTPAGANLLAGNYLGFARVLQNVNGTNVRMGVLQQQRMQVIESVDSELYDIVGPITQTSYVQNVIDGGTSGSVGVITRSGGNVTVTFPAPGAGSGDMLKSVYDVNTNGVVDNAEALGGTAAAAYATDAEVAAATNGLHTDITNEAAARLAADTAIATTQSAIRVIAEANQARLLALTNNFTFAGTTVTNPCGVFIAMIYSGAASMQVTGCMAYLNIPDTNGPAGGGGGSGDFLASGVVRMTGALGMNVGVMNLGSNAYAFGDSLMDGDACSVPASSNIWHYIENNKGWSITNLSVSGGELADFVTRVYGTTIRDGDSSFALWGYNDMRHRGESVPEVSDFKAGALSLAAWLSIPQASIVLGQSASVTNVGTWTNSTHYGGAMGVCSSTESNGVYLRLRGPTIYANVLMAGRGFNVFVDGTNRGVYATGTYTAANSGTNCLPQLIRIGGLAPGWHDVALKVAAGSGTAHFLWAASPRSSLTERSPSCFLGGCLDMTVSGYATGGATWDNGSDIAANRYSEALEDVAKTLAADGLNTAYVDVQARWVADSMVCADQVHPNAIGYATLGEAYLVEMNSASRFTGRGLDDGYSHPDRLQVGPGRSIRSFAEITTLSNCVPIAVWNWVDCATYTNAQNIRWYSAYQYPVLLESLRATVTGSGTATVAIVSRQEGTGAWTTQATANCVGFTNIDLSSILLPKTNSIGMNLVGGADAANLNVVIDGWISSGLEIDLSSPATPPDPPPTGTLYGAAMNKTNSSFVTASAATLGLTNSFTFCAWVSLADSGGYDYSLFQLGSGFSPVGPSCIKLVANATVPGGTYIYWSDSSSVARKNYTYPALGTSTQLHVALTYDGSTITLYTNGSVCVPSSTPLDNACVLADDTRKVFLGSGSNNDGASIIDRLQGKIYEAAFYPRALAATAITAIVSAKCGVPQGSPNHNWNTYVTNAALEDTVGAIDLLATNIVQVSTILTNCP